MFLGNFTVRALSFLSTASLVSAAVLPISTKNGPGTYSITQIVNTGFTSGAVPGPAAMRYAYTKHDIKMPAGLVASPSAQTGSVAANPFPSTYDREYLVPVSIGTGPQTLPLDLDTGSADLWVFSGDTAISQVKGQALYRPALSSTSHLLAGQTWSITYGDGSSSSGNVYSDVVSVGGLSFPAQGVESAKVVSSSFSSVAACSGLLGLAFGNLNQVRPTPQKTFMDNIKSSLALPLFTANLKKGATGTYDFGYINSSSYTGEITYAPVSTTRGLWEFISSGYQVGNNPFVPTSIDAIADTGTSLLLMPQSIVLAYWSKVQGAIFSPTQNAYVYPCANPLPIFTFGLGAYRGVVPGNYLNYGQVSATQCYGGLQSQGTAPFSIFGDILLKAQFVVFDLGNTRIGFANKPTGGSSASG